MQNDFNFAFENNYDDQLAMETPVGWGDYTSTGIYPTKDELIDVRRRTIDVHRNVEQADVFIVTLGLIEAWFDKTTGKYLNAIPSEVLAANLSRFECRITDYQENLEALRGLIAYLRQRVRDDLKVIVTVRPCSFVSDLLRTGYCPGEHAFEGHASGGRAGGDRRGSVGRLLSLL